MQLQRLLVVLTVLNVGLLTFSLVRQAPAAGAQNVAPVLRGRGLEILDDRGRVRASISILPADPDVRMPDGTRGYPETVLLRLINSKGRPNVKIETTEVGAGVGLGGESDPTYVSMLATGGRVSLKLTDKAGRQQSIAP